MAMPNPVHTHVPDPQMISVLHWEELGNDHSPVQRETLFSGSDFGFHLLQREFDWEASTWCSLSAAI